MLSSNRFASAPASHEGNSDDDHHRLYGVWGVLGRDHHLRDLRGGADLVLDLLGEEQGAEVDTPALTLRPALEERGRECAVAVDVEHSAECGDVEVDHG